MEIILLIPMLIVVFAGVVLIFVVATALFPVTLAGILIYYFRRSAANRAQGRHPFLDAGRRLVAWCKSLIHPPQRPTDRPPRGPVRVET